MFKRLLTCFTYLVAFTAAGCVNSKITDPQPYLNSTKKQVTFTIYTDKDFSDARWNDAKVQVNLRIARIQNNPYGQKTVFDTTLAWIEFKDLPDAMRKIQVEKKITNVDDNEEAISVSYTYTTSIDGYVLSAGKNDIIKKREAQKAVNILF